MEDKKVKQEVKPVLTEEQKIKLYHKSRRMFCIYKKKLIIAERNVDYSHEEWFTKNKWKYQDKDLMNEIVRGVVDDFGDVYFYIGRNHTITEKAEAQFFPHLKELAEKLKLPKPSKIYGGVTPGKPGEKWPPIREYGSVRENLYKMSHKN